MKATFLSRAGLAAIVLVSTGAASRQTDMGTAFTYQGELEDTGGRVTDTCDFEFSLWDAATGGNQKGSTLPMTTSVDEGLFTVELDFGDQFNGDARWLEIKVCCPSPCTPVLLTPRQELTPTPYALHASDADTVDGSHGCKLIKRTPYSGTGDYETLSTATHCGGFPKGCTIRLISTQDWSATSTADNGEAFGFYNQNWYYVPGGWRVVAMTSDSTSVYTAAGVNGDTTPVFIMSAGSCELKDDTAAFPSQTTWVVNDSSGTYECFVYVCD